ncbi:MAG: prolyl oligopeptidase family serine peptidase [Bacteroidales bacterium]|nr:prolyl oligopeptidase family serine peptidase [Bacteroidales bacterium]
MKKGLFIILLLMLQFPLLAQIKIWDGTICRAKQVTLTEYWPEGTPKAAIIICPGSNYHWMDNKSEGTTVAQWLAQEGYLACVLRYRVAGKLEYVSKYRSVLRGNQHPDMVCDLQRAMQILRTRYNGPVGVLGFSAGGHLVMTAGEFYNTNFLSRYNLKPASSMRPDFIATIYPVVTLSDDRYVHSRSRVGLLGERNAKNKVMQDSLSVEKHVRSDMPPVFMLHCQDDQEVSFQNSVLLDSALTSRHVPHYFMQLETGGHGFGADPEKMNEETATWQGEFLDWLHALSF